MFVSIDAWDVHDFPCSFLAVYTSRHLQDTYLHFVRWQADV